VISTINGDSNVPFYKEFANQGLRAEDAPIMAFSVAEDELRGMDTTALVGHLAAWNYYQSVDTPQNKQFVANFKAYCKKNNLPDGDKRVTDDPIEAVDASSLGAAPELQAGRTERSGTRTPSEQFPPGKQAGRSTPAGISNLGRPSTTRKPHGPINAEPEIQLCRPGPTRGHAGRSAPGRETEPRPTSTTRKARGPNQRPAGNPTLADQADFGRIAQANARRVDVDLDAFGLIGLGIKILIGKTAADDDQRIASFHRVLRRSRAEQADPAGRIEMVIGHDTLPEERFDNRRGRFLG
jgi:hypothetical protein